MEEMFGEKDRATVPAVACSIGPNPPHTLINIVSSSGDDNGRTYAADAGGHGIDWLIRIDIGIHTSLHFTTSTKGSKGVSHFSPFLLPSVMPYRPPPHHLNAHCHINCVGRTKCITASVQCSVHVCQCEGSAHCALHTSPSGLDPSVEISTVVPEYVGVHPSSTDSVGEFIASHPSSKWGRTSIVNQKKRTLLVWSYKAVLLLLEQYGNVKHEFFLGEKRHSQIWDEIAEAMQDSGYKVTGVQCKQKLYCLKQTYATLKKKHSRFSTERIYWPFFSLRAYGEVIDRAVCSRRLGGKGWQREDYPSTPVHVADNLHP
ncbi:hypothetical protein PR048_004185 [Dryococelus australis]|uniref:Myb/SANT-like DNA-binding domain-containing protein n=1 Tax=Dryococelus australis TaxID=614101 RepID=A0ABQ9I4T2_9NEOP|nr:hypothetical protein PR048_004185 [Dryococelus australis]